MSKWQSGDIPIFLTMLALFLSFFSDKIEEFTSDSRKYYFNYFLPYCIYPQFFIGLAVG